MAVFVTRFWFFAVHRRADGAPERWFEFAVLPARILVLVPDLGAQGRPARWCSGLGGWDGRPRPASRRAPA